MIDEKLKRSLSESGFNLVAMSADKIPLDVNGKGLRGAANTKHVTWDETPQHVKDADKWGIAHSTDKSDGYLFLDWDKGEIPDKLKKLMSTYRKKGEQGSYHGIIKVDANKADLKNFVQAVKKLDCGLEVFAEKKRFAIKGNYKIKDSDQTAKWSFRDSLHQNYWEKGTIKQISKTELSEALKGFVPRKTNEPVPAGQGLRHPALVVEIRKTVQNLTKTHQEINFGNVFDLVSKTGRIQQMEDYQNGIGKKEFEDILEWCVEHRESEKADLGLELIRMQGHHFAHDESDSTDQFNCWYWKEGIGWKPNTDHLILSELHRFALPDLKPNSSMAKTIRQNISALDWILHVDPETEESKHQSRKLVINQYGQYFDLQDGKIKDVDPERVFYRRNHLKVRIGNEPSKEFENFMRVHFNDSDHIITFDQVGGSFVHTADLGTHPQILTIGGPPNAGKSILIEVLKAIIDDESYSEREMEELAKNTRWGKYLIGGKILNVQEEAPDERIQKISSIKALVTAPDGKAEVKGGGEVYIDRFPRWVICCNIIPPLPLDDDMNSLYKRNQYVWMHEDQDGRDWRKILLDPEELPKIAYSLLMRAHEIYTKSKPIRTQSIEEAKKRYEELVEGDFNKYIQEHYVTEGVGSNIGTRSICILNHYNKTQRNKISGSALASKMDAVGFEKKERTWVYPTSEANVFDELETSIGQSKTQQTLFMGLKPKKITKSASQQQIA